MGRGRWQQRRAVAAVYSDGVHRGRQNHLYSSSRLLPSVGNQGIRRIQRGLCVPNSGRGPERRLLSRWLRIRRASPFGRGSEAWLLAMCDAHSRPTKNRKRHEHTRSCPYTCICRLCTCVPFTWLWSDTCHKERQFGRKPKSDPGIRTCADGRETIVHSRLCRVNRE